MEAPIIIAVSAASVLASIARSLADARARVTRPPSLAVWRALSIIILLALALVPAGIVVAVAPAYRLVGEAVCAAAIAGIAGALAACTVDLARRAYARTRTLDIQSRRAIAATLRAAEHDAALEAVVATRLECDPTPTAAAVSALAEQLRCGLAALPDDAEERPLVASAARQAATLAEVSRRVGRLDDAYVRDPARLADVIANAIADANLLS